MHNHSYRIPWLFGLMSFFVMNTNGQAQVPAPASPEGVEVLAKGPVHEAFAATAEAPVGGSPIIKKAPPEPIEELPPDQKPEGEQVQWLPGYWSWDEDRSDFIWISGFWRVPPPGRVWVAGSWREASGGFQWVNGFWQETQTDVQKSTIDYLPPPPQPVELAPSIPAPSEDHIYVPGSWVYRNHYVWRPGFWVAHRPGWIWIPASYRWTPAGYVFIDGYWDYPLDQRGMLFAPIAFTTPVYARPRYYYQPTFAISVNGLYTSMFVRRGYSSYYFGDYYGTTYASGGYNPWCGGYRGGSGFAISIGFGGGRVYDPMWDYYRVSYRNNPGWNNNINATYAGRYNGTIARPPVTLVQQTTVINKITNNNTVNNTTINNNRQNLTMVTSIKDASTSQKIALKPVTQAEQVKEQQFSKDIRTVGTQRRQMETQIADRGNVPMKPADKPRSIKMDVPTTVSARGQVSEERKAKIPPPAPKLAQSPPVVAAPVKPVTPATTPKVDPKPDPKPVTPMPKVDPKPDPKPVTPMPKVDPKPDPKPVPKVDPKPVPKVDPKPEPKPVTPVPTPKVEPVKPVTPVPTPKLEPKPVTPPVITPPAPKPVTPPVVTPAPKPVSPPVVIQPAPRPVAPPAPPVVQPAPQPRPVAPPAPPVVQPAPRPVAPPPVAQPAPRPAPRPAPPAPKSEPKGDEKPKPKER
ncbi:hypothetical protein BH11PLA2_BH11PLA2_22940 [soil metagenome]